MFFQLDEAYFCKLSLNSMFPCFISMVSFESDGTYRYILFSILYHVSYHAKANVGLNICLCS